MINTCKIISPQPSTVSTSGFKGINEFGLQILDPYQKGEKK